MNFELGFYRTRDGSIVELLSHARGGYLARVIKSTFPENKDNNLGYDFEGNCGCSELDLMEYLKVKENGIHEGLSIQEYIKISTK